METLTFSWCDRLPAVLQARLASKPNLTAEHLRDAVLEACAIVDEELPGTRESDGLQTPSSIQRLTEVSGLGTAA